MAPLHENLKDQNALQAMMFHTPYTNKTLGPQCSSYWEMSCF